MRPPSLAITRKTIVPIFLGILQQHPAFTMQAYVEDEAEVDAPSDTTPATTDVVGADSLSGPPSITSSGTPPHASTDPMSDMYSSTELDMPLPRASELNLDDLHLKAEAEAEAYRRLANNDNQDVAKDLHLALEELGRWARTMELFPFDKLVFLERETDYRARDIVRIMRHELDQVSTVIHELTDIEIQAAGDGSARQGSPIEERMFECRRDLEDIIQGLEELRDETDYYWPALSLDQNGPSPDQNGASPHQNE
ncbi:hypothetical protein BDV97DRAFT_424384 [Delphinella strobiligena]|nr:hypothetical protein BDV97DRAFT_424384 [Delphinella strobiligena]